MTEIEVRVAWIVYKIKKLITIVDVYVMTDESEDNSMI